VRKGEATRARILDEAARQAAVRGLSVVSLNDVAEAVGLSKSGLFKHFDSKEAMQRAVLEATLERFTRYVWAPASTLPPGRPRLEKIFERWIEWSEVENAEGGCLLMSAGAELDDQPGPLRDLLQAQQLRWSRTLQREFQALFEPDLPDRRAKLAAFQMKSFVLGHNENRRLLEDADARSLAMAAFKDLLDRISNGG
jgi:AcrR family transcriptional regulator